MKKTLLIAIPVITLALFGVLILRNQPTTPQKSSAFSDTSATSEQTDMVSVDGFSVSWYEATNIDKLKLIANFDEKSNSIDVKDKNNCKFLSSSVFYSTDNKPLGLFESDGQILGNFYQNDLLDGILSINEMATPRITRPVPQDNLKIAIQSGPIMKENGSFINLKIKNDSGSRRVIAGVTGENKLIFAVFFDPKSEFLGPELTAMPNIIKDFEAKTGITFADVINLDGGSASAFYNSSVSLSEINPVGAFFCQY